MTSNIAPNNSDQAKGRIKQAAGDLSNNQDLKNSGTKDRAAGNAKELARKAKEGSKNAIETVKNKLRKK